MRFTRATFCMTVFIAAVLPALSQDLVAVAPQAAKVEYEDARVRVIRLRIAPNASLPMHDRPSRVIIPLTTSEVRSTRPDGRTSISRSVAGQPAWGEPAQRSIINLTDPVENIVVELKQAAVRATPVAQPPTPRPMGYLEEPFHHWAFENQYVRVYDVRVPPGETTDLHIHAFDSVAVRISGGLVAFQAQGHTWSKAERLAPGSVEFSADAKQHMSHRVRNEGTVEYRVILVQFLR